MPKPPRWEGGCISAVVNGRPDEMRAAVAHGLPLNDPVFGRGTFTPLHYAIDRATKPAVVAVLLDAGADVNARTAGDASAGRTPLMLAARRGRLELVKLLLAAGAKVNAKDDDGLTAMAHACWEKHGAYETVLRELLAAGGKADTPALAWAAWSGTPGMVRMLAAAGADLNATTFWGTPLVAAVDSERADTAEVLLAFGADPTLKATKKSRAFAGVSPLELAREQKLKKVLPMLEAAAAGKPPKVAKPKPTTATAGDVWDRLEKALKAAAPDVKKSLKKGAAEAKLTKLEATLGVTLPADLRFTLLRHDGQTDGSDCLFPEDFAGDMSGGFLLMSVAEIESEWKMWKELNDGGEFAGNTTAPDKGVRKGWWNPGWVPFATDGGGDSLCVDLTPAKGGTAGQIIHMRHDSGDRPRLAKSLAELLAKLCDHYEQEGEG